MINEEELKDVLRIDKSLTSYFKLYQPIETSLQRKTH